MKKRNLVLLVVFSIITFGIYYLVVYCSMQNQIKTRTGQGFGGVGHFFATIFSFGIYAIYWYFVYGSRLKMIGGQDNGKVWGTLYLVSMAISFASGFLIYSNEALALALTGIAGIIAFIPLVLIQKTINELPEQQMDDQTFMQNIRTNMHMQSQSGQIFQPQQPQQAPYDPWAQQPPQQ